MLKKNPTTMFKENPTIDDLPRGTPFVTEMKTGQSGYTVPWAIAADKDGKLWFNTAFTLGSYGGTTTMLVEVNNSGVEITCSDSLDRHSVTELNDAADYLPVVRYTKKTT